MRRFSINVNLRKKKAAPRTVKIVAEATPARDGLVLSGDLASKRQALRQWADFQRALMCLPPVTSGPKEHPDPHLALEYVRIYEVTREKLLEAAPGFETADKLEQHCYFDPDGAKHVVSRLLARPHARVTELSLYPGGEVERVYYENTGGPEQNLDDLYQQGLGELPEDLKRFASYPHYRLKFVLLSGKDGALIDIFRGVIYYHADTGALRTEEE